MKQKVKLVSKKLTLKELEHQLWMAAHIITGPIDASDYKTYIFPILFFKRINDVYNEEFEIHHTIFDSGCTFIEDLMDLGKISHSTTQICAIPLKMDCFDGAPMRTIAIDWN